uniref:Uncharacterized protein n=1 Tax=Triparma pacifica TaxID=91992 RepID=A0A7S2QUY8_9STRA|mmetsp:Transcript_1123/g.2085  ORF Transcript_1123/g.2085 Transcript_1123/m.2085 type:complete len:513 (+) Transcript_1123:41-1579(+)
MHAAQIVSIASLLIGAMVGVILYLQSQNADGDGEYLAKSKWTVTAFTEEDETISQVWYIDVESMAIRVESTPEEDKGTVTVEEFIGGKKYTYFTLDATHATVDEAAFCAETSGYNGSCPVLASELSADVAELIPFWSKVKSDCVVEDAPIEVAKVKKVSDGTLDLGGFFVTMVDGVPSSFVNTHNGEVIATIESVEDWSGDFAISGCSPENDETDDGEGGRRSLTEMYEGVVEGRRRRRLDFLDEDHQEEVEKARNHLNMVYINAAAKNGPEAEEEAKRILAKGSGYNFGVLTGTNWCGPKVEGVCGGDTLCRKDACSFGGGGHACDYYSKLSMEERAIDPNNYDLNRGCPSPKSQFADLSARRGKCITNPKADHACHRHDAGKKATPVWGGVKLGCDIDHGLISAVNDWFIHAVFGKWGVGGMVGCFDKGKYKCWKWFSRWWGGYYWYGNYCSGHHTHYGPWRFSSYSHHWGYKDQKWPMGKGGCNGVEQEPCELPYLDYYFGVNLDQWWY